MDNSSGSSTCPDCVTKNLELDNLRYELDLLRERVKALENDVEQLRNRTQSQSVDEKEADQVTGLMGHNDNIEKIKEIIEVEPVENFEGVEMVDVQENSCSVESAVKESPFENHLIIEKITNNLDLSDLLNCRLVNSLWNVEAYKTIINFFEEYFFEFYFSKKKNCYLNDENKGDLQIFNKVFKNSPKLPYTSFRFEQGSMTTPDIKLFLTLYGHLIKKLILDMNAADLTLATFSKLLVQDLPNLETLVLECTPKEWNNFGGHLFPDPTDMVQLKKLSTIVVDGQVHPQVVSDILRVAVNLKKIEQINFSDLPSIASLNKLDLITNMFINPNDDEEGLRLCQKLVQSKFQLTWLCCNLEDLVNKNLQNSFSQVLTKIFFSHTERLETLILLPLTFVPNLRLPILNKVKIVTINGFDNDEDHRMLPLGQYFHEIFPNVVRVQFCMEWLKLDDTLFDSLFLAGQQILTVKILDLHLAFEIDSTGIEKLATFFPNLKKLKFSKFGWDHVPKFCTIIWKSFSKIEKLVMSMTPELPIDQLSLEMDSAFTGFSVETCKDLRINSRNVSIEDVLNLRENPSILDMKKLKSLKINFKDIEYAAMLINESEKWPIFTHVTGVYGFRALKLQQNCSLKLTCGPDIAANIAQVESVLSPVLSYMDTVKFPLKYPRDEEDA